MSHPVRQHGDVSTVDELAERVKYRKDLPPPAMRKLIRESAGVTQAELAEALGVSRVAVIHWERGDRYPRRQHLDGYARALRLLRGDPDAAA